MLDRGENQWHIREQSSAVSLRKPGRRRADAQYDVGHRSLVQRLQIFDERRLGTGIVEARGEQRVLLDIEWPGRLPLELGLDVARILAPRPKITAERMQYQDALQFAPETSFDCTNSPG
ncbi:hypothetical protein [Bradyrhizobium sp. TM239]|uniref:hypothetical protein n=1 Tax=Bradyrhizobium sp. TM239 TaxID=2599802 RepID=UPI0030C73B3C